MKSLYFNTYLRLTYSQVPAPALVSDTPAKLTSQSEWTGVITKIVYAQNGEAMRSEQSDSVLREFGLCYRLINPWLVLG